MSSFVSQHLFALANYPTAPSFVFLRQNFFIFSYVNVNSRRVSPNEVHKWREREVFPFFEEGAILRGNFKTQTYTFLQKQPCYEILPILSILVHPE